MGDPANRSFAQKARDALREGGPSRLARVGWDRVRLPFLLWRDRTWLDRRNVVITAGRRLRRQPVVHVIGDSHTQVLRGVSPFRVTWLGPATAYNLGKEGSTTRSSEKLRAALGHVDKDRDVVVLVLGEIDTRIHIFDQHVRAGSSTTFDELIDATIERYGEVILGLKRDGYRVVVHSVPATPHQGNIYEVANYADDRTRAAIVRGFNDHLKRWCAHNDVEYLDVYPQVSDQDGFILPELTDDGTHLAEAALPLYRDWLARVVDADGGSAVVPRNGRI